MKREEKIYWKAYHNLTIFEDVKENDNRKVIKGLSKMIVHIWQEWKSDTRHYQPANRDYNRYMEILSRGEALIDPDLEDYVTSLEAVADCKIFLQMVVHYRVRNGKCRVY